MNVVFKQIFDIFFFVSAMVDVDGVKTTLKNWGAKHILFNISKIIEDTVFVLKLMKLVFFKRRI